MEADGTITGLFGGDMRLSGTVNSVAGLTHYPREKDDYCSDQEGINQDTWKLQAELVGGDQKFEGTLDNTYAYCDEDHDRHECGSITTFSLDRE